LAELEVLKHPPSFPYWRRGGVITNINFPVLYFIVFVHLAINLILSTSTEYLQF